MCDSNAEKIHLKSSLTALIDLEKELKNEDYTTVSQVMNYIHDAIEWQKNFNKEKGL